MEREVGGRARVWCVLLGVVAFLISAAYLSSVLGIQYIRTSTGFTNASILEDRQAILNISINNTDFNQTGAVTGVTITLPSQLVYTTGTQNVSSNFNNTFSNTTTVLNWSNTTLFLVNGSVDGSGIFGYFWFNVSVTGPGIYNVVVRTFNGTGESNYNNLTVNVNDTTNATGSYVFPSNNTGTTSSIFNYSGNFTDNFNLSRVTLYIWNSSSLITPNETSQVINTTAPTGTEAFANFSFTFPREGRYYFNFLVNDTANNSAFNATNFTIVYDITRPLAEFNETGGTSVNYINVSRNWTFVNVTVTETNEANITFTLYNSTASVNTTTFTTAARTINWTDLRDDKYSYNITIVDIANNRNDSITRNITIDTTRPLVAFNETGGTSVQNTNASRNWTFVNVTVTETNEKNITFGLYYTNGTSVNVTTFTDARRTINWTGLADGRYFYNISVADYVDYQNTTTSRNITIDTTRPLIVYNTTTANNLSADYANVSLNWIFVNVTVTETNEANITFSLYNGTGGATNVTTFSTAVRTINWTGVANGNYTYNVTITDLSNNRNTTTTRRIFIDTTSPSVSVTKSSSTKTSLTLTLSATDATSGVNTPCTTNRAGASVSGNTITESSLACSTSYTYDVACNDFAGNAGTTSGSFSTDSCSSGAASGGGGGGGSSTVATWTSTFVPESTAITTGYTKSLAAKERVRVSVGAAAHHVGILEVTSTSAKVQISSTPQEATLAIGESKKFEVTNDSTYDLLVTLVSITAGKAEITIKAIEEPFSSAPVASPPETGTPTDSKNASATSSPVLNDVESKDSRTTLETRGWVIGIIVLIIVVCVIVFLRRKK